MYDYVCILIAQRLAEPMLDLMKLWEEWCELCLQEIPIFQLIIILSDISYLCHLRVSS